MSKLHRNCPWLVFVEGAWIHVAALSPYEAGLVDPKVLSAARDAYALQQTAHESKAWDLSPAPAPASIQMLLHCPQCGERHIDEGEFATKAHHTHACQECGHCWRPAVVNTVGVRFLPGFKNDTSLGGSSGACMERASHGTCMLPYGHSEPCRPTRETQATLYRSVNSNRHGSPYSHGRQMDSYLAAYKAGRYWSSGGIDESFVCVEVSRDGGKTWVQFEPG